MKTGAKRHPRVSGNHLTIAEAPNVGGVWGCPKYLSKLRYQDYRTGRTGGLELVICDAVGQRPGEFSFISP